MSKNVDTVMRSYKLFNEGKIDEALELYDNKAIYNIPGTTVNGPYKGKKQLLKLFTMMQARWSEELRFRVENVIENKNHVVVQRTTFVKAPGIKLTHWQGVDIHELRDGKIVRTKAYADTEKIALTVSQL